MDKESTPEIHLGMIKTRFFIISDTHADPINFGPSQKADVAIHGGDLTEQSKIREFRVTIELLKSIDAPLELVIAGNHDFIMDIPTFRREINNAPYLEPELVERHYGDYREARELFNEARDAGIVFLEEGTHQIELNNGASMKVYASPFTPSWYELGFQYHPYERHQFNIQEGTHVVVTHGPPRGIMDLNGSRRRAGCPDLFDAVARARPLIHCFGHIHQSWGSSLITWKKQISNPPSYVTDIDHTRSTVIEKLSNLDTARRDRPSMLIVKAIRRAAYDHNGCV
ncbi:Metallo-dependent phosphatase [Whalleya microplaca]|nr:Metallo-dependent phosphatase [Whalleya microplaca]